MPALRADRPRVRHDRPRRIATSVIVAADTAAAAVAYAVTLGVRTPLVADRDRVLFRALGVTAVPAVVRIEIDGHVRRLVGSVPRRMLRHFVLDTP